jgi:Zn-dependent protease with chaperone function
MLLLPAVYFLFIADVAWLIFWHLTHNASVFEATHSLRASIVAYLLPLAAGILLLLFMIKPLFARRAKPPAIFALSRVEQRHLYTFVDKLCTLLGSPKPTRIDVDCQVNASASFNRGFRGLFSNQLVLTIGMPLAAGLSLPEFTSVLAHEFGHFSQGTGMRLTFIVRSINAWFARLVYERDSWDQFLIDLARGDTHWTLMLFSLLARLMIWITRRILWGLMHLGALVSSFMLRQMEFDADLHAIRVVGSSVYNASDERIRMLAVATNAAFSDLTNAWRERRLCDDLPHLIVDREHSMPADIRSQVRFHFESQQTGWFDTHPADLERRAAALRENAPGIFHSNLPARALFNDFDAVSRRATELFYRQELGPHFSPDQIVATSTLVDQRGQMTDAANALDRVFQGLINPVRPVFPRLDAELPDDPAAAAERLLAARNDFLAALPDARVAVKPFDSASESLTRLLSAQIQARAHGASAADAEARCRAAEAQCALSLGTINAALRHAVTRLEITLALESAQRQAARAAATAEVRAASEDVADYALVDNTSTDDPLLLALDTLRMAAPALEKLRRSYICLATALSFYKPGNLPESVVHEILHCAERTHADLKAAREILCRAQYPYDTSLQRLNIAHYASEQLPGPHEVGDLYQCAKSSLNAIYSLYLRILADLAARVEATEKSFGLDPLPSPPKPAP